MSFRLFGHSVCPHFVAVFSALTLCADEAAPLRTLTAEECLSRVAERSPDLQAGAYRVEAAASRVQQAARRPNPRLETEVENVAGTGDARGFQAAESTASLVQEVEWGDKRQSRVAAAEAEVSVSRADEAARRHTALFEARRAVLSVLLAQEKLRLSEGTLALVRETEAVVLAREQAGKATAVEVERANAERARAELAVQSIRSEQRDAVRELALCWGETEPAFDAVAGSLAVPAASELPPLDGLVLRAANSPALLAADAQARLAEANVRVERAARKPNIELAAGVRRFEEFDGLGFVAGVGVELPLFNSNRGAVRAAERDAEAARLDAVAVRLKNEGFVRRLYAKLQALAAREAQLRATVVPPAERALALVREAYGQGKVGQLDVLDARRSLADAQLDVLGAAAEYHACRIELDQRIP